MRSLIQTLLRIAPVLLVTLATACASSPDTTAPTEDSHFGSVVISFSDFRPGGARLTLANEAALNRVDYYSTMRNDAGLKVASDEIINALVEVFEAEGFWDDARPGNMPKAASMATEGGIPLHGAVSLETGSKKGWITFRKGLSKNELELFQTCSKAFIGIYNNTAGYQRVNNPEGEALFKKKKSS